MNYICFRNIKITRTMGKKAVKHIFVSLLIAATAALFAAAAVCWRASFVAPSEGRFWLTAAMLMPVVLGANFLVLVWWIIRRRWLVALMPLAGLAFGWGFMTAYVQPPAFSEDLPSSDVRIATLNVHGFRYYDSVEATVRAVANIMRHEEADVLCMQEFVVAREFPLERIDGVFDRRMPHFVSGGGLAIASRFPIVAHEYAAAPRGLDDYLWADLLIGGNTVRVFTVHLHTTGISGLQHRFRDNPEAVAERVFETVENNSVIRSEQVRRISAEVASSPWPVILAGDFNDTPSSYTYRTMSRGLTDGFREAGHGFGGTFRGFRGLLRIDYIFHGDRFSAVRYRTLEDEISDHKAVVAELVINK